MAQKTDAELTSEALVIKNEATPGLNTANRIGNMLVDLIDSKTNVSGGGGGGGVPSVNGETGAITLRGNGIGVSVTDPNEITISNDGVTSLNGKSGNVSVIQGSAIIIEDAEYNSIRISNAGVTSINGLYGVAEVTLDNVVGYGNEVLDKNIKVIDNTNNVDVQMGSGQFLHINRNSSGPFPQTKVNSYYGTQWYYQGGGSYERYVGIRQDVREVEDNIYNYLPEQSGWLATRNLPFKGQFVLTSVDSIALTESGLYYIEYQGSCAGISNAEIDLSNWLSNDKEFEGEEIVLLVNKLSASGCSITIRNNTGEMIGNNAITGDGQYRFIKYGSNIYTQRG